MTEKLPPSSLRIGLPSGSLQSATVDLFGKAGYRVSIADRSGFPRFDDDKISAVLFRAQEISRYVVDGIVDCGLTGYDWIVENGNDRDVVEVCELEYSRASRHPARRVGAGGAGGERQRGGEGLGRKDHRPQTGQPAPPVLRRAGDPG